MAYPVPETLVRTSHSLTIIANSEHIGLINGWNPTISRTITPIYQIARFLHNTFSGDPVEKVPGNVTGQTIAVQRYDLYVKRMEKAFGTDFANRNDLMMLTQQDRSFSVREVWDYPIDQGGGREVIIYGGCWFSNIGRNYR
ncbi:hypothetical protein LCGC14_1591500, partial [marine sediment metagenome]